MIIPDDYLGDGVYASFDGFHVVLDLRGQDSTTRIALEPLVFQELVRFQKRAWKAVAEQTLIEPTEEARKCMQDLGIEEPAPDIAPEHLADGGAA